MKNKKRIKLLSLLFIPLMLPLAVTVCSSDLPPLPTITNVVTYPEEPDDTVDVTVSASVTPGDRGVTITSVVIQWTLNGVPQNDIPMTRLNLRDFSGRIPVQALDTKVEFTIVATNSVDAATSVPLIAYTVALPPLDFRNLRLNEIYGVASDTYIELYNIGRRAIPLEDVDIFHIDESGTAQLLWAGATGQEILPREFLNLTSAQLISGLPAGGRFTIELRHPEYDDLDSYHRPGNNAEMNTLFGVSLFNNNIGSKRIPDGTGPWYFFSGTGTPGDTNGTSAIGLIVGHPGSAFLAPQSPLFWLRLNELNGVISNDRIYIELFNIGSVPIDLEGIQIYIKDYNFNPALLRVTEGEAGETIDASGFFVFRGRGDRPSPNNRIGRGLSSSRAITVTLKDADGRIIDRYNRAKGDSEMNAYLGITPALFGSSMGSKRIPDGTGSWYFFSGSGGAGDLGTPDAPNPTTPAGLIVGHPLLVIPVPYE